MNFLGSIGFLSPWLLLPLLGLPLLWWLLRVAPPAPLRRRFPAVTLLLGLRDRENTPERTPWWLLLLRMLAIGAAILAFAQPVLNLTDRVAGKGPLVIAMDGSWASAQTWRARKEKLGELLHLAELDSRPVALLRFGVPPKPDAPLPFANATRWIALLDSMAPQAWEPDLTRWAAKIDPIPERFETVWFSDGLARAGRADLAAAFAGHGDLQVVEPDQPVFAIAPAAIENGLLRAKVLRLDSDAGETVKIVARGPDPAGITRVLARTEAVFAAGETTADITLNPPSELRNRIRFLAVEGIHSAGAVSLTDDSIRRRKVALIAGASEQEGAALVSPLHFLRKALVPTAEVIEADLLDSLTASPDVVILADVGKLAEMDARALIKWIDQGGVLVRFAGPLMAASGIGQRTEHPLLPVRLRAGGRSVGGTMSWGEPKKLREFTENSPFFGLPVPDDVLVRSQVVAQPDPNLSERVLAMLADGTPLVTGRDQGRGRIILFHVTANAEWSSLPLSGLFVQMLERLAISTNTGTPKVADLQGRIWMAEQVLDGFGRLHDAPAMAGIDGARLAEMIPAADLPPGLYASGDRRVALNVIGPERVLQAASWPAGTSFMALEKRPDLPLKSWFLLLALAALCLDLLVTLRVGGRLSRSISTAAAVALFLAMPVPPAQAQTSEADILYAANNTVLAYVKTGDRKLDALSHAGLLGLSAELFRRTSIEPVEPVGVNVATDPLALYPFLYWPVSETQELPSDAAIEALNTYLHRGGMILFDTRDANLGGNTPNGRRLQQIAAHLNIPPLEPIPEDHVLTRSFYLLQVFPGRYNGPDVWVEAAPENARKIEGMPFRNLNDGVTPVVIGGNDWAGAWAINGSGQFMFPVGRGANGLRQREIALRFGVNLIMYVLTGNYKSDQVHVPALLDRLGQ
jgi:hypothetical protein